MASKNNSPFERRAYARADSHLVRQGLDFELLHEAVPAALRREVHVRVPVLRAVDDPDLPWAHLPPLEPAAGVPGRLSGKTSSKKCVAHDYSVEKMR